MSLHGGAANVRPSENHVNSTALLLLPYRVRPFYCVTCTTCGSVSRSRTDKPGQGVVFLMRKRGLIVALLIGAGCKSTDGPEPLVTTTVQVTSTPNTISVNETAQASALVKDQNGAPLTGKTITWTSLNQSVATVTPDGVIRGV